MQWVAQDVDAMLQWPAFSGLGLGLLAGSSIYANTVYTSWEYDDL